MAEACLGGVDYRGVMGVGSVSVVPAKMWSNFECGQHNGVTLVSISPELVDEVANNLHDVSRKVRLLEPLFNIRNDTIASLSNALVSQLRTPSHPAQRLIYDGVSHALAAELLRLCLEDRRESGPIGHASLGLPLKVLAKVIEHIEEHVSGSIGLDDLARVANVSRFHFLRLFKLSTGITPMAYVERLRLKRSEELMRQGDMTFTEIALAVGFADQSHFARRFRRLNGLTPGQFRQEHARRFVPKTEVSRLEFTSDALQSARPQR